MKMTCDNDCTRANWTEALIIIGDYDLHISHAKDADIGETFQAFCHDEQEMLSVNGWLIECYEGLTNAY